MALLEVTSLQKGIHHPSCGGSRVQALSNVSASRVEQGEYVAIMGESRLRQDHAARTSWPRWTSPPAARCCWTARTLAAIPDKELSAFRREQSGLCVSGLQPAGHLLRAGQHPAAAGALGQAATARWSAGSTPLATQAGHRPSCWTSTPTRSPAGRSSAPPWPGR